MTWLNTAKLHLLSQDVTGYVSSIYHYYYTKQFGYNPMYSMETNFNLITISLVYESIGSRF